MQLVRANTTGQDSTPGPAAFKMPAAMVDKSVARLCWISVFSAVMTVLMLSLEGLLQPEFRPTFDLWSIRLTIAGVLGFSAIFLYLQRSSILRKEAILNLGLLLQVVVAFAISMYETTFPWNPKAAVIGHSGVAIWLALCGLLLPNTPLKSGIAALCSALAWPAAYFLNLNLHGFTPLPWNRLLIWFLPILMMAVWMYVINARIFAMQWKQVKAEELGAYKLDYLIGKGGMGEVWRARHTMLARDAAVKLIRADVLAGASGRQEALIRKRFEREARATASLRSPHTVALYDFGHTGDGTFYYVMELLDGIDLQTLVDVYGPLPPGRVWNILLSIADSLEEAHRAGMIHRDIKPKNIVLAKLGLQYDFVKVLDFGLVKARLDDEDSQLMTLDGSATGTPAYIPPEIAMASSTVDRRADLYSLGCVAYFLLTGKLVFEEPTLTAMALAHVQKKPVPPSERSGIAIDPGLEKIVMELLEKNPDDRIPTARDLQRRLRKLTAIPRWCEEQATNWWLSNLPESIAKPLVLDQDTLPTNAEVQWSPVGSAANG